MAVSIAELEFQHRIEVTHPFDSLYNSLFRNHKPRRFFAEPYNLDLFSRSFKGVGKVISLETSVFDERSIPDHYLFDHDGFTYGIRGTSQLPPVLRTREIENPFASELTSAQRMFLLINLDKLVSNLLTGKPFLMPVV